MDVRKETVMSRINPEVLRSEREKKKWSIDDLAKRSRVDRQSIHRIENGSKQRNRNDVIEKLAKALGISAELLTGASAPTTSVENFEKADVLFERSQLNLRVSNQARNALFLASLKYRVTQSQIVEIAPLLFCWAAKQSLKRRADRLDAIKRNAEELWSLSASHLAGRVFDNWNAMGTIEAELNSIGDEDLFGTMISGDGLVSFLAEEYDEATENPFANFIEDLATEIGEDVSFNSWSPLRSPKYYVCKSLANRVAGGDEVATDEILEGGAPLHKIADKPDFFKLSKEERAKLARDEASASREKYFTALGLGE